MIGPTTRLPPRRRSLALLRRTTTRAGWGAGGGVIIPVMPKFADLTGTALIGRGIERYGSGQLASATFSPNGSLNPLPEAMFLAGAYGPCHAAA